MDRPADFMRQTLSDRIAVREGSIEGFPHMLVGYMRVSSGVERTLSASNPCIKRERIHFARSRYFGFTAHCSSLKNLHLRQFEVIAPPIAAK